MSKSTDTPTPIIVPSTVESNTEVVEKPNLVKRGVHFVKSHKKAAIAVAAFAGLVGVSAVAGRATAPSYDTVPPLELEPADDGGLEYVETTDTTVA